VPISLSYTTPLRLALPDGTHARVRADTTPPAVMILGPNTSTRPFNVTIQVQVRFCRYRFCPTGELKYRGAVGLGYRSTYKRTLYIKFCC
jgi:hypothetical protein